MQMADPPVVPSSMEISPTDLSNWSLGRKFRCGRALSEIPIRLRRLSSPTAAGGFAIHDDRHAALTLHGPSEHRIMDQLNRALAAVNSDRLPATRAAEVSFEAE